MENDCFIKEIRFSDDYPSYVPDGNYEAKCIDYSEPYFFMGTKKITLTFELLNPPYQGEILYMHMNIPLKGSSYGSSYFRYWTMVHGKLPSRNALMSPRIFKGKNFLVKKT